MILTQKNSLGFNKYRNSFLLQIGKGKNSYVKGTSWSLLTFIINIVK